MITLYDRLPESVVLGGSLWPINPDFRIMIRFEICLLNGGNPEELEDILLDFYGTAPMGQSSDDLSKGLLWFYRCGKEQKEKGEGPTRPAGPPVYSYEHDAALIYAAFLDQYNIDLISVPKLHWWQFRALFDGLKADNVFVEVRRCRAVTITANMSESQQTYYREMKKQHALPLPKGEQQAHDELTKALMTGEGLEEVLSRMRGAD